MIAIEEQLHRYATDVAGPAVGGPLPDLEKVGAARHRARWVLVAALVLFVAGLGYVAMVADNPSPPSVATTSTTVDPNLVARPTGLGSCTGDGSTVGMELEGTAADGLCVSAEPATGELVGDVYFSVYSHGTRLAEYRFGACWTPGQDPTDGGGASGPYSFEAADGSVVMIDPVPTSVASVRLADGPDPMARVETFELEVLEDVRWGVARVSDHSVAAQPLPLDASGQVLDGDGPSPSFEGPPGRAKACLNNGGPPSVTIDTIP